MLSDQPLSPPIRVALCITELDAGGAEHCLAELAARLDKARFQPVVYCVAPLPTTDRPSVLARIEQAGVEIHALGMRSKWQARTAVRELTRLFRQQQPQIVQSFLFHANIVARLAARRAGVPHIVSGIRVAERRRRWHLWLDRLTAGSVERHVCVSQSVADFARDFAGLPRERLVVISNGVDIDRYRGVQPADLAMLGIPAGRRAIVYVGRLDDQKRVDWLLRLSPTWMQELPNHDLLLVGDGPRRAALERLTAELGIADRVHFAGWQADVPAILAACELLVLPSAWEGMPNVVLEAMASRKPVVSTNVEGVAEVLGPAATTQMVDAADPAGFSKQIKEIAANPHLARELAAMNYARVERDFSLATMVTRYEQLYTALVNAD